MFAYGNAATTSDAPTTFSATSSTRRTRRAIERANDQSRIPEHIPVVVGEKKYGAGEWEMSRVIEFRLFVQRCRASPGGLEGNSDESAQMVLAAS